MPAVSICPVLQNQIFDNNGNPLSGGKIKTYQGGSFSVPRITYADSAGTTPNPTTIVADSAGRIPAIFLVQGQNYNIELLTAGDVLLQTWTNIRGVDAQAGVTELSQLSDVTISSPSTGEVLTYDGTEWTNQPPAGGGGPPPLILRLQSGEARLDGVAYDAWSATTVQSSSIGSWNAYTNRVQLTETGRYQVTIFSNMYGYYGSLPSTAASIRYGSTVSDATWPNRSWQTAYIPSIWDLPDALTWTDEYVRVISNTSTEDIHIQLYAESYGYEFNYVGYEAVVIIQRVSE